LVDPEAALRIHPHDLRRIIRALEIYYLTGESISFWQKQSQKEKPSYQVTMVGLNCERTVLYRLINQRVDKMIENGLAEEVKNLLERFRPDLPSLQSLGYREIVDYLKGKYNLPDAVRLIKRNTRRYAKRQLTWFRKDTRIVWFDALDPKTKEKVRSLFLTCKASLNVR
jgi:tRNA dimethylallyltransferase